MVQNKKQSEEHSNEFSTQENKTKNKGRIIEITFLLAIIVICGLAAIYIATNILNQGEYTTEITYITGEEAYDIINGSANIRIIDVRGCKCNYKTNHIPTSIWNLNPNEFKNSKKDIIIYDNYGKHETFGNGEAVTFCEYLVGTVYGKIYCIENGFKFGWETPGYPMQTGEEPGSFN